MEPSLLDSIDQLEARFEEANSRIEAFLPEAGRFARLRSESEAYLRMAPTSRDRTRIFGWLVGVKDIFHVDGFPTRAGSQLSPKRLAGPQGKMITRLKNAGALIVGKTVTTEFAYFAPGPTRNPHNLDHTPGGSSSGSAAAVAAGLVPLALGTQTIGSIIRPASFCGVVGFKPTYERISRSGVIPLSPAMDHVGFFTKDIAAAQKAAEFFCDRWQYSRGGRRKPVLGIPTGPYLQKAGNEMLAHFEAISRKLEQAGYLIKAIPAMADFDAISARHNLIVAVQAWFTHLEWFAEFGDRYHPKTVELLERGRNADPAAYTSASQEKNKLKEELTKLMQDQDIDLWLSPAAVGAAPHGLDSTGDPVMNLPWTQCGFPTINLPSGNNKDGLPLGLQVTAGWGNDETLLRWARGMEAVLNENL